MINWTFDEKNAKPVFSLIPVGEHRARIESAEELTSKTGNEMIKLCLKISGYSSLIFHYIVFMPDKKENTDRSLSQLYSSLGMTVPKEAISASDLIGKVGAVKVKHEPYNGEIQAKIAWFIPKDKQDGLPLWQENATSKPLTQEIDADIPF